MGKKEVSSKDNNRFVKSLKLLSGKHFNRYFAADVSFAIFAPVMTAKKGSKLLTEILNIEGIKVILQRQHEGIGIILKMYVNEVMLPTRLVITLRKKMLHSVHRICGNSFKRLFQCHMIFKCVV
jgi:hypothetical protein